MKRITIFNEKGGVGKTTLTMLLAGYLAYVKGKRVCVLDFDSPSYHLQDIRRAEDRILQDPRSPLSIWLRSNPAGPAPYDILSAPTTTGDVYDARETIAFLQNICSCDYDWVLYDFPGRFTPEEIVAILAANGWIDFVAIPMDTDSQSRRSALVIGDAMVDGGIPCAAFWNKVSSYEAKGSGVRFRRGAIPFEKRGIPVMAEPVREIKRISRDSDEMLFVRSTYCFPVRYINHWSPAIIPFLEALVSRIEKTKSIKK